jgi:hypothetical protein
VRKKDTTNECIRNGMKRCGESIIKEWTAIIITKWRIWRTNGKYNKNRIRNEIFIKKNIKKNNYTEIFLY